MPQQLNNVTLLVIVGTALLGWLGWLAPIAVDAFPTGAGSCASGTDALLQPQTPGVSPHATNRQIGTGNLSTGGFTVSLDGTELSPNNDSTNFVVGQAYNVTLVADSNDKPFRGFLIRIGSSNSSNSSVDTTTALSPISDTAQSLELCISAFQVSGITHINNDNKTQVVGQLQLNTPADSLLLDVTVVVRNSVQLNVSEWYFSRFTLNAKTATTATPTSQASFTGPTAAPSSLASPTAPTAANTTNTTNTTTTAPNAAPSPPPPPTTTPAPSVVMPTTSGNNNPPPPTSPSSPPAPSSTSVATTRNVPIQLGSIFTTFIFLVFLPLLQ